MKTLLIAPPHRIFEKFESHRAVQPFGLLYIASNLESYGAQVDFLDAHAEGYDVKEKLKGGARFGLKEDQIIKRIKDINPDLVGVSCISTSEFSECKRMIEITKKVNPKIKTVMGGVHPSILPKETLEKCSALDFIIIGEAEHTICKLIDCIKNKKNIESLDGIVFRRDGEIIINPNKCFEENLDSIPFPARHLIPKINGVDIYSKINFTYCGPLDENELPYTFLLTSRGCPTGCSFCSTALIMGKKIRERNIKNISKEIKKIVDEGYKTIQIVDDNLTIDRERTIELCKLLKKHNLRWGLPNGTTLWTLDDTLLEIMADSGCNFISLAIETANQETLNKTLKKPLDLHKVPHLIQKMKKLNIETDGFFMIGIPGETKQDIQRTLDLIDKLMGLGMGKPHILIYVPLPGTKLYEKCIKKGYISKYLDWNKVHFSRGFLTTPEFNPKYLRKIKEKITNKYSKGFVR